MHLSEDGDPHHLALRDADAALVRLRASSSTTRTVATALLAAADALEAHGQPEARVRRQRSVAHLVHAINSLEAH